MPIDAYPASCPASGHLLNGIGPITCLGVYMKIALDHRFSYENRKSSATGLTDFLEPFSQFGLDERDAEGIVKGLFRSDSGWRSSLSLDGLLLLSAQPVSELIPASPRCPRLIALVTGVFDVMTGLFCWPSETGVGCGALFTTEAGWGWERLTTLGAGGG
jgi:hypothetical protein